MSDIRVAEYELGQKVWYKISDDCVDTTEHDAKVRSDAIDEVFKKLYEIRDSLPFKYLEHWTPRDSDAISTLFIEYEKQLKEQNNG